MRTENNYESLLYVATPARYEYIDTEDILKASQPQSEGKYDYTDTKRKPNEDCVQAVFKNCHAANRDRARTSTPDSRPSCIQNGQSELKQHRAKNTEKSKVRINSHPKSTSYPANYPLSPSEFHSLEEPNAEKKEDQCKVREIRSCFMI